MLEYAVMASFLGQYYGDDEGRRAPREILTTSAFDDEGALKAWLREQAGRKVEIRTPRRGDLRKLVTLAARNAEISLTSRLAARDSVEGALVELQELRLDVADLARQFQVGQMLSENAGSVFWFFGCAHFVSSVSGGSGS